MELTGKAALITGGARIGREVALALARRGCRVALTYGRSRAAALETVKEVRALGVDAQAVQADLSRPDGARRAAGAVSRAWGGVDVLVHMASVYNPSSLAEMEKNPELVHATLSVDLEAGYRLALLCSPAMRKRGGGRIIFFSDWLPASGRPRYKGFLPYYVAKGAVKSAAEALALELAPSILVNAVAPGPTLPPPGMKPAERREVEKATPLGRWGGAAEIAKAVLYFIESDFVTGETLRVDGGRHLL